MGYTTDFWGKIDIVPPLNEQERDYLEKFSSTRRMQRENGPYFVDGTGDFGQGQDPDITNFNTPAEGQPGLWCDWVPNADGTAIEWNGGEKFYNAPEWMVYIIEHFLKPGALADLPFLQKNHVLNGTIDAQGEDPDDRWRLIVRDNVVRVADATPTFGAERQVEL